MMFSLSPFSNSIQAFTTNDRQPMSHVVPPRHPMRSTGGHYMKPTQTRHRFSGEIRKSLKKLPYINTFAACLIQPFNPIGSMYGIFIYIYHKNQRFM